MYMCLVPNKHILFLIYELVLRIAGEDEVALITFTVFDKFSSCSTALLGSIYQK